jgi:hypothetical protein
MTLKDWISGLLAAAALLATGVQASAAELPALHTESAESAETSGESGKSFDIPGSGLHVTYGGYIEGAVTATLPKNAAPGGVVSRRRKPTE